MSRVNGFSTPDWGFESPGYTTMPDVAAGLIKYNMYYVVPK